MEEPKIGNSSEARLRKLRELIALSHDMDAMVRTAREQWKAQEIGWESYQDTKATAHFAHMRVTDAAEAHILDH